MKQIFFTRVYIQHILWKNVNEGVVLKSVLLYSFFFRFFFTMPNIFAQRSLAYEIYQKENSSFKN